MWNVFESSVTAGRCAVGRVDVFKTEVELHHGLALSLFFFAIVKDRLTEETMLFADDSVISGESEKQVEESIEKWRHKHSSEAGQVV